MFNTFATPMHVSSTWLTCWLCRWPPGLEAGRWNTPRGPWLRSPSDWSLSTWSSESCPAAHTPLLGLSWSESMRRGAGKDRWERKWRLWKWCWKWCREQGWQQERILRERFTKRGSCKRWWRKNGRRNAQKKAREEEKRGKKRVNQKQTAKKLIMQHKMQKFMDFMKLAGALTWRDIREAERGQCHVVWKLLCTSKGFYCESSKYIPNSKRNFLKPKLGLNNLTRK